MSTALIQPGKRQALVRAAIYLRITRDDQKTGLGVERQLAKAEPFASVLGWTVVLVVDENDTKASGRKPRPKYQALLAQVRRGEIDAIIGYSQDRLTRKPREAEDILDLADSLGVRVATVLAGAEVNFSDPNARHQFRNATASAALEIELNRKRSTDEREQRAMAGRRNGATPFGWRRALVLSDDGTRVVGTREELHPTEAVEVQEMARKLLSGISQRAIAADLNARGVAPRSRQYKGQPVRGRWDATNVRRVLLRESNIGQRVHQGQVLEGVTAEWPAILDEVTYRRVVALLSDPVRLVNVRGAGPRYLLSGLLTCARCPEAKVHARNRGRGYLHYVCSVCHQGLPVADLDNRVSQLVVDYLAHPRAAKAPEDVQDALAAITVARDAILAEQAEAGQLKAAGAITLGQLVTMNEGYSADLKALDAKASALLPDVAAEIDLPNGWAGEQDLEKRRTIVRQLFATLEMVPNPEVSRGRKRPFRPTQDIRHVWR